MDHTFTWIIGFTRTFHMVPTIAFIINIIIIIVGFLAKRAVLDIMEWVSPWGLDNSQEWDAPHMLPIIIIIITIIIILPQMKLP